MRDRTPVETDSVQVMENTVFAEKPTKKRFKFKFKKVWIILVLVFLFVFGALLLALLNLNLEKEDVIPEIGLVLTPTLKPTGPDSDENSQFRSLWYSVYNGLKGIDVKQEFLSPPVVELDIDLSPEVL